MPEFIVQPCVVCCCWWCCCGCCCCYFSLHSVHFYFARVWLIVYYSQCKNCHGHSFIIPHTAECVVLILFVIFLIDIFPPVRTLFLYEHSWLNGHLHYGLSVRVYLLIAICLLSLLELCVYFVAFCSFSLSLCVIIIWISI